MKSKLLHTDELGQRTFALIMEESDKVMECLQKFATSQNLSASGISGIGAFKSALLGYFEIDKKKYKHIPVDEQTEVLTLTGDISLLNAKHKVHAHVILGRKDGSTRGGHLLKADVRPTLELIITESPVHLYRSYDEKSGLALIRLP